jgi:hypothetical protein
MGKLLILVSLFTIACAAWLVLMEEILRHPGYAGRVAVALAIGAICVATVAARLLHASFRSERWLWAGAAALIGFGAQAFWRITYAAHFEGFVFIISLLLLLQGVLMFSELGRPDGGPRFRAAAKLE